MRKIEDKINQMLMFGFNSSKMPKDTGGIIIFERNTKKARKFINKTKIAQFVAIDQEGGRVNRITKGVTILPPANEIKSPSEAYRYGRLLAKELIPLGINLNLAPVTDVNTEKMNPIIGSRSFGSNPVWVSKLASSMIHGMQNNGLMACAKHFPGHGPTKKDSHLCLPKVNLTRRQWMDTHLLPFMYAVKAGVKSIMTGHVLYKALDKKYPASLSYEIVTGWLKKRLGYKGLIITDDLGMAAVKKHYGIGEAAVMAVEAGNDIVLVCKGAGDQRKVRNALVKAVKTGRIDKERIEESYNKIMDLKIKWLKK